MISVAEAKTLTENYILIQYKDELEMIENAIKEAATSGYSHAVIQGNDVASKLRDYLEDLGYTVSIHRECIAGFYRDDLYIRW